MDNSLNCCFTYISLVYGLLGGSSCDLWVSVGFFFCCRCLFFFEKPHSYTSHIPWRQKLVLILNSIQCMKYTPWYTVGTQKILLVDWPLFFYFQIQPLKKSQLITSSYFSAPDVIMACLKWIWHPQAFDSSYSQILSVSSSLCWSSSFFSCDPSLFPTCLHIPRMGQFYFTASLHLFRSYESHCPSSRHCFLLAAHISP